MAITWRNAARTNWEREVTEYLNALLTSAEGPPMAQMSTAESTGTVITPGDVVKPYVTAWGRDMTPDKTAGTITVTEVGVYAVDFGTAGTLTAPNTALLFSVRANGVKLVTIQSLQKQVSEGVEAAISGYLRVTEANSVIDATLDESSDAPYSMQQVLLNASFFTTLDGIQEF
jgi:hypothetical protein